MHGTGYTEVARLTQHEEIEELLALFGLVAEELHWQPDDQLSAYVDRSLHMAALEDGVLAGGLQLVLPDERGYLPCLQVWPEFEGGVLAKSAHVTILALSAPYRGHTGLFWPLCVEVWRYCADQRLEFILLEATPPMLRLYRRLGFPLEVTGELRIHWGEPCYLCRMGIRDVAGSLLLKALRSPAYNSLVRQAIGCTSI